jgi:TPR repeat protein
MHRTARSIILGAIGAAGLAAGTAHACDETQDLYKRGYYEEYIDAMKAASERGDTECQFRLGTVYRDGVLTKQDYGMAVSWYRLAASRGHPYAQFELGTMYDNGEGVQQDYAEAVRWYEAAANQGFSMAQHNLAVMYEDGVGVPKDIERARLLYDLSTGHKTQEF